MTKRSEQKRIMVRLVESLNQEIELRKDTGFASSTNRVIERDLTRYYYLLRVARNDAQKLLSDDEAALIVDNLNGTIIDEYTIALLPHHIRDGIELDHLDEKWSVDGERLIAKLDGLPLLTLAAIVDAAERFWAAVGRGEDRDPRKMLDET